MQRLLADESQTPQSPQSPRARRPAQAPGRRYHELDWLRAFIILALVPAHAIGFYTSTTSQYYGTKYSIPIGLSTLMTIGTWGIALLFLVAGAATNFALVHRSPRQYIGERFVRLMFPFLFASLTLIPLQDYLIIHTFPGAASQISAPAGWNPHFANSPLTFYRYFVGAYALFLIHYSPQYEFIFWSQLWFIPRLFVISLLTLPLLLYLRAGRAGRAERILAWLAELCERYPGAIFLLAAPLVIVNAALGWQWQGWQVVGASDGANVLAQFLFYAIVYVYGFALYADKRLRHAVWRDGGVAALVIALLAFGIAQIPGLGNQTLAHDYSAGGILAAALRTVAAWCFIVGVMGLSMRFLAFTNRIGGYLTEASYPFYVLHLAALYLIGLPLLASGAPAILSFLVMVILTYVVTLAVYEVFVRRTWPTRLLFGLSKSPDPAPA